MQPMNLIDVGADVLIPNQSDLRIRTAVAEDARYVLDRAHRWRKRVGWLPASALEAAIERQWVWICEIDGQPAGHTLITGGRKTPYVLRQNCVEKDLWGQGLGTCWTAIFLAYAHLTSPSNVAKVRTRQDIIEQTIINAKTGARPTAVQKPNPSARGNSVITWEWRLSQRAASRPRVGVNVVVNSDAVQPFLGRIKALPDEMMQMVVMGESRGKREGNTGEPQSQPTMQNPQAIIAV